MQPQQNLSNTGTQTDAIVCSQCGSPMPKQMRFCRSCGNRLGDGPAEYTETVRFDNSPRTGGATSPFYPSVHAPLIQQSGGWVQPRRKRAGFAGMTWLWILLVVFFVGGGAMSAFFKGLRVARPIAMREANRSYFGVDSFDTTDGGVTFDVVEPPGGPADKAGLVGGDVITNFDGSAVKEDDEIMDLLAKTPVGKTVDVTYIRDANVRTTQLTTVSREEYNRLEREYDNRPQGKGKFGFELNRMTKIKNAETKTFGVIIDWVETNSPADLFGIKKGDIITDFDGVPIRTPEEFRSRVRRTIPYTQVNITLLRDGQKIVVPVKMGKA